MLTLYTLGRVDLIDGHAAPVVTVTSQPKRVALLAYLATAEPRGLHRRDVLVSLFWPELDAERARAALRRSLHFLRGALGPDVLVARGDAIGVDFTQLDCDVIRLEDALTARDADAAVSVYAGEFLSGLHVREAPELEQWIDARRRALRERVAAACWAEADAAMAAGAVQRANGWSARAVGLAPYDEAGVRRRLLLLRAAGDDTGVLHAYGEFAAFVAREFGGAPSATTRAIADGVRAAAATAAVPTTPPPAPPPHAAEVAATDGAFAPDASVRADLPAALVSPAASSSARPRAPAPRRRWFVTGAAIAVAAIGIVAVVASGSARRGLARDRTAAEVTPPTRPTRARAEGVRLAVFPFALHGGPTLQYLRSGVPELLAVQLDGAGSLHVVDLRRLSIGADSAILDGISGSAKIPEAATLARRAGADLFTLGAIVATSEKQLQLVATVYDLSGDVVARLGAHAAGEHDVFAAIDSLARQITASQFDPRSSQPGGRLASIAALTTRSLPALRRFLAGERAFAAGRLSDAGVAYADAATIDTTFALAHYRLSRVVDWGGNVRPDVTAPAAAARAARFAARLPAREQALLRAYLAREEARPETADSLFRNTVARYPDDVEAWHEWGEFRFHSGHEVAEPMRSAGPMFAHVLVLDPSNLSARLHLARLAALEHQWARLDTLLTWIEARAPSHEILPELRIVRAAARDDGPDVARRSAAILRDASPVDVDGQNRAFVTAWRIGQFSGQLAAMRPILGGLDDPARAPDVRLGARLALAQVAAGLGEWREVDRLLASAAQLDRVASDEVRAGLVAFVAPAGALALGDAALSLVPSAAEVRAPGVRGLASEYMALREQAVLRPVLAPFLRGILALRGTRGGDAPVTDARNALADLVAGTRTLGRDHARMGIALGGELRSEIAIATGNVPAASRALGETWALAPRFPSIFAYPLAARLLRRATVARAMGDVGAALRWCEAAEPDIGLSEAFAPQVARCRAELRPLGR